MQCYEIEIRDQDQKYEFSHLGNALSLIYLCKQQIRDRGLGAYTITTITYDKRKISLSTEELRVKNLICI